MKVLILACLVAFALANQSEENVFSEEFATQVIKEKLEELKFEEKQPKEDERWNKIHSLFQQQSKFHPSSEPFSYPFLPQHFMSLAQRADSVFPHHFLSLAQRAYSVLPHHFLSLAQRAAMSSYFQQEMENAKAKETSSPNCKAVPFPKSPIAPSFEHQNLNLTDFENMYFSLPLFQSLMQQAPQPIPQVPMFPPQSWMSFAQLKFLPVAQHNMPYAQNYASFQHYPLNSEALLYYPHNQLYL